jgi:hypothetical protein
MTKNQSAAAVLGGCCFIISSIPLFISLAEGSALWVPTLHPANLLLPRDIPVPFHDS